MLYPTPMKPSTQFTSTPRGLNIALTLALVWVLVGLSPLQAALALPKFFSEGRVLQRNCEAKIWGTSSPEAAVTVNFRGAKARTNADNTGHWSLVIKTGEAEPKGSPLKIETDKDSQTIAKVYVGEVWLASGQSNMYWSLDRNPEYIEMLKKQKFPHVHMFSAALTPAAEDQNNIEGSWHVPSPDNAREISSVAFFFANKLQEELQVPVGILKTCWGGKPVETFTSREALSANPKTKPLVDRLTAQQATFDPKSAEAFYQKQLAAHEKALKDWQDHGKAKGKKRPKPPTPPSSPMEKAGAPGVLYSGMIHPFVGYTLTGAIWYQGESNAKAGHVPYDVTLPLMIEDWRQRWGQAFAFNFVQLANFKPVAKEPGNNDPWPLLQDRMRRILDTTPNTGMAVLNDVGDAKNIHPPNKRAPGERLAIWALAKTYDKPVIHSGPLFVSSKIEGNSIHVSFKAVGEGLASRDNEKLARFEIAGADKVWHWAEATIEGKDTVVVSSSDVPSPAAVRYAWAANPEGANLVNSAGLPASIFRTDDWDDVEDHKAIQAAAAKSQLQDLAGKMRKITTQRNALDRQDPKFKSLTKEIEVIRAEILKLKEKLSL